MEPVRPASSRRRPRRGSVDRPIDVRLVRKVALVLVPPAALLLLSLGTTGPLPAPTLPPSFDGSSAATLTRELVLQNPNRVPGSPGADAAARWFAAKMELYGLRVDTDLWQEDVPGLGSVQLRNVVATVPGATPERIVLVAHRDNRTGTAGVNDNASGTAALIELARAYATAGTGSAGPRRPLHTLVFASTDAGAFGDLGAARLARSDAARGASAALVLDGIGGRARPHLSVAGGDRTSPGPALVRTLEARLQEAGARPVLPGALAQLVALGIPLGLGEQARLLEAGIPSVRVGTASDLASEPGADELESLDASSLGRLGRALDASLSSLDAAIAPGSGTSSRIVFPSRTARGWMVELLLIAAVVPFAAGVLDLLARCRRRRSDLSGAFRAYRRRFGYWLAGLVALLVVALAGALPFATEVPPRPDLPPVDRWPSAVIALLALLGIIVWLRIRVLLAPRGPVDPEAELTGWAAALVGLLAATALVAVVNPFALAFVLPSLYAWLALVQIGRGRPWLADALFGLGLLGPAVVVAVLAQQLELGVRAPLYAASLVTSGTVPWLVSVALAAWFAAAGQIGALAAGRYAPAIPGSRRR